MINVWIDEFVPCLKNSKTGDFVETEVVQIKRKSFLEKFNKRTGWYTNWADLLKENEIYALVLKGTVDIQGLVAVHNDDDMKALRISWMCSNLDNNKNVTDSPKFIGVGGHLFAIAAKISIDCGYNGLIYGYAANEKLFNHYIKTFNGEPICVFHPYHFAIDENTAKHLMEVYNFDWTNEEL